MSGDTWLVLGASSAIARAFARQAALSGADLILAGRDLADIEATAADIAVRTGRRALSVDFDALDFAAHAAFIAGARELAGASTLNLFLAFGLMPPQAEIDADPALARRVIETNYLGAVSVLQAAAPVLESQGRGTIVALGSVAGDRGRRKNLVYGSAKAGLAAYLQGLRQRLAKAGVNVVTVKPGYVDTAMTFGLPGVFLLAAPAAVARACLDAAQRGRAVVYAPAFWRAIMAVVKAIPEPIFKRLGF
ncbi:MAG: SDR family oxidoreductase [Pseudomonadota bacterium]